MQKMQYMNAPPDIQAGASEIFQRQKLAEMLRQQAIDPIKADEYSKTGSGQWAAPPQIVKVGMGQGLAKLAQAGVGGYMQNKANEDQLALANQVRKRRDQVFSDLDMAQNGSPATQGYDAVAGYNTGGDTPGMVSTYEDGTPQPVKDIAPQAAVPGQAAVPPADTAALASILRKSGFADLEKWGDAHLFPTKNDGFSLTPGQIRYDASGKQIAAAPEKTVYEKDLPIAQAIAYRDSLPPGSPNRAAADNYVRKLSETPQQIVPHVINNNPAPVTAVTIADPKDPNKTIIVDGRSGKVIGAGPKLTATGERESKRSFGMSGIGASIQAADDILSGKNGDALPTASGVGTAIDTAAAMFGQTPEGAKQADKLRAIGGSLTSKMPRMEGPQSDKDVALYKEMAGRVGDSTLPIDRRRAALDTVKELWSKYEHLNVPAATAPSGSGAKEETWVRDASGKLVRQ